MKLAFVFSILLFNFGLDLSFAEGDCVANITAYNEAGLKKRKSIFASNAKNIKKLHPSKLVQYGFEDRATLKNGVEVVYVTGGCAHYGFSFLFSGKELVAVKETEKLNRAEQLIKDLKLVNDTEKDQLLKAIADAKSKKVIPTAEVTELPCGDAYCELTDRNDMSVKIGYSFAL